MKAADKIWFDGKLVDWKDAQIHILSHVVHYGSGVFEGIRMYETDDGRGAVFRLEDHCKRLVESAKIYYMEVGYSPQEITDFTLETLRVNRLKNAYIRPIIFRGYGKIGLDPRDCPTQIAITAFEWGTYMGDEALENGISACISSWHRPVANTLPGLSKACGNYLNSQLIRLEASNGGYDEGIALNVDGYLAEGSGENVFVCRDGVIYTPSLGDSLLPGITRDSIIKLAKARKMKLVEMRMPREFLYLAQEIFMTGTAVEITPVTKLDGHTIGTGRPGPMTKSLQQDFFAVVKGQREDWQDWLSYVYSS